MHERMRRKTNSVTSAMSVPVEQEFADAATTAPVAPERSPGIGFDIGKIDIFAPEETDVGDRRGPSSTLQRAADGPVQETGLDLASRIRGPIMQRTSGDPDSGTGLDLASRIHLASGTGGNLDGGTRDSLERGLGADLSQVRVHADAEADQMARSVDARAFTTGQDIFFRSGAYDPESRAGKHLLAHEATHTVQQAAAPVAATPATGEVTINEPGDPFEREAESAADALDENAQTSGAPGSRVMRATHSVTSAAPSLLLQRGPNDPPAPAADDNAVRIRALEKKTAAANVDHRWEETILARLSKYRAAADRVAGGLDTATANVQAAKSADVQLETMWTQILAGAASILFSAGFEWVATTGLGRLDGILQEADNSIAKGLKLHVDPTTAGAGKAAAVEGKAATAGGDAAQSSIREKVENPANATVSATGNVAGAVPGLAAADAQIKGGQAALPSFMSGSPLGYFTRTLEALDKQTAALHTAFSARSLAAGDLTNAEWAAFDLDRQEAEYRRLDATLEGAGKSIDDLKAAAEMAKVIERYFWAQYILDLNQREVDLIYAAQVEAFESGGGGPNGTMPVKDQNVKTSFRLGSNAEGAMVNAGVSGQAGVILTESILVPNSSGYREKLVAWAKIYKDGLVKGT